MAHFSFPVDSAYAYTHNELLKDTKRLQISAALFALILLGIGYGLTFVYTDMMGTIIFSCFAIMAAISLALIVIIPKTVGTPVALYEQYELCAAMIAEVEPRTMTVMALVNMNTDPTVAPKWGLAIRPITALGDTPREVGVKVPSVAVTGRRSVGQSDTWDEISPMPIIWGTADTSVIERAEKEIPTKQWKLLEANLSRVAEVRATRFNLLPL
ncbi:DUF3239 domain-containing protein [Corynebacterium sp. HS2168-gen11]|uniref:DUF3239 domain-containing protein n=1 Tax=Corynebacterium sp. HS2168-gen11 TaxID=2974027 RepID=UPI00216AC522|nr:DUF3239 domain-containing protein [Corynebacterium sp. HS2168-gen11]MCS4536430.1 DUF3239 domain-containing protein [Corynebacterium sp. HS2168-gen11]